MRQIDAKKVYEIDEFIEKLIKDRSINLTNFNNNLKTLKIYEMTDDKFKEEVANSGDAAYNSLKNEIYLSKKSNKIKSIYHELFHMASAIKKEDTIYTGFLSSDKENEIEIGRGINEGYTELLAERYFNTGTQYHYERIIVKQIEKIVGENFLKQNYFDANLNAIIGKLEQYSNKKDTIDFIYALDNYCIWMNDIDNKIVTPKDIQEALDYCCKYLIYAYINKLQIEEENRQKITLFNNFITDFDLGYIVKKINNHGEISIYNSLKKISEETNLFSVEFEEKNNFQKK